MKILLAILLCPVLAASQCFAIDGGPWGGGGGRVSITGTYAGVLVPIVDPVIGLADNSLSLFTLVVPKTGLATGTTATFRGGYFYPGTIRASADPDSAKLTGVISASFTRSQREVTAAETQTDPVTGVVTTIFITTSVVHTYEANGQLTNAKIVADQNSLATSGTRIKGKASITYVTDAHDPNCTPNNFSDPPVICPVDPAGDSGGPIQYKIRGFKQAELNS